MSVNPPPFFLIGAEKAGTSSLVAHFDTHPDVELAETKSMCSVRSDLDSVRDALLSDGGRDAGAGRRTGLKIAYALRSPSAPGFLHDHFPDADLIASLRNPVDRAYSSWWMYHQRGMDRRTFETVVQEDRESGGSGPERRDEVPNHISEGHYVDQVKRYRTHYSKDQLKIVLFERFRDSPEAVLNDVYRFLSVSTDVQIDTSLQGKPAMGMLGRLAARFAEWTHLTGLVPKTVRQTLRGLIASIDSERPEMDPEIRETLLDHYRPYNRELADLLDRDLSLWDS